MFAFCVGGMTGAQHHTWLVGLDEVQELVSWAGHKS
jgi:hypothetical protein